jgi:hypothetical protein
MKLLETINNEFSEGRSRTELGSGVDHMVFTATDDSNIVYKLGPKIAIDYWYEDFKKNPNLFPKVYKRGRSTFKLKSEKQIPTKRGYKTFPVGTIIPVDYVKLEKLDTERVQKEWDLLSDISEEIREIDDYEFLDFLIIYMTWKPENKERGWNDDETIATFDTEMKKRGPQIYKLFRSYVDLVDNLKKVKPGIPDIHRYNFGYDKKGKLKCLDF